MRLKHWSRAERPIAQVPRACHAHGAEKASRQEAPCDSSAPGNVPGARARVPRPLSLCLPGPLTLHLPFCGPLTGFFCSWRSVGCESGPRRPPPARGHASSFLQDPGPGPDCGVGAPPQPLSPLSGPLLLSATATVLFLRPANTGLEHGSAFPPCYQLSRRSTQRATGGEPTLLGPALCREKRAVSAAQWGAEHRRGPGVQGWGLLCPSPLSQSPVCICSPSSQHQGPSGLTDSDTWLQTEKADCQGLGTFWEAPNGRAMQSPGLAAKWPSPSGWQGVQHSRDATRLCGPGTGWSGQLVCYSCSGNSAREGRRRSDNGALEPLAH